jgi:hypothetical protein
VIRDGVRGDLSIDPFAMAGYAADIAGRKAHALRNVAEDGAFKGAYSTNGELVQSIATRADRIGALRQGLGNGPVAGTAKHEIAKDMLIRYQRMFGDRGLLPEQRFVNGAPWRPGDPVAGSIRLDVVEGPLTRVKTSSRY